MQGVALGGEWAGAVLLSVEHGDQKRRGLSASWTQIGPSFGTLLGTGCIALVTLSTTSGDFLSWGWRVPFAASALLVVFGFWLRRGVDETPQFEQLAESHATAEVPVADVLKYHWKRLLIAGGSRIGSDVLYALIVVFTLTYVTTVLHLSRPVALTAVMIGTACNALAVPCFGALSDRFGRRPVYLGGALAGIVWAFVFFTLLDSARPGAIVAAVAIGLVIHAVMYGPQGAFVTEQFPTRVRYAGVARVHARRHRRRRLRAARDRRAVPADGHDDGRVAVCRRRARRHVDRAPRRTRNRAQAARGLNVAASKPFHSFALQTDSRMPTLSFNVIPGKVRRPPSTSRSRAS